ncbi:hypothetical protein ES731_00280 [Psychroflexus gondwanensis]|jgi:hypothetical protein|uniref:Uncharacterized protein n=1 Tax=Psychroflexus gondwanensis ACAM 44 TaxID=1189619 RepID=N1WUX7_9FLAO|nr:hypothetical protein [Psychroflexus gondwanensis]EMY80982.1 hypothetical protein pgond44_10486 [Psychroflexus gondwanensis ACAM 44]TXE21379.1 hypothetical protein ES731_00280 [Psychroflexus gondwanensis]
MFTPGRIAFIIFFVVVFVAILIYSYIKDKGLHNKYYKGSLFVLLGFFTFIISLVLLRFYWREESILDLIKKITGGS